LRNGIHGKGLELNLDCVPSVEPFSDEFGIFNFVLEKAAEISFLMATEVGLALVRVPQDLIVDRETPCVEGVDDGHFRVTVDVTHWDERVPCEVYSLLQPFLALGELLGDNLEAMLDPLKRGKLGHLRRVLDNREISNRS
jgi:hypothetical protein